MALSFRRKSSNHQNKALNKNNRKRDRQKRFSPYLEMLEERRLLCVVMNTNDGGMNSFRQCILDVNAGMTNVIDFNIPGPELHVLQPLSPYDAIINPVTIDGFTQSSTSHKIEINGSFISFSDGLVLIGGQSTVRGLIISGFTFGRGLVLAAGDQNTIEGNFLGTDDSGMSSIPNLTGIAIESSNNNTIGNSGNQGPNLISGNIAYGLQISSTHNVIQNNLIGTDINGEESVSNGVGVFIDGGNNNTIGGTTTHSPNLISGNQDAGIEIQNSAMNMVEQNLIGTKLNGRDPLGSQGTGVSITAASDNLIGGLSVNVRNIIGNNTNAGIALTSSTNNRVQGNYIGLNSNQDPLVPNGTGIVITAGTNNTIGGTVAAAANVISGNTGDGIQITGSSHKIWHNFIGTNDMGDSALPNGGSGVVIQLGGTNNTIGGSTTSGSANVISGNHGAGITIRGSGSNNNLVQGNLIGTTADGMAPLGNDLSGITISNGAANNTIGGTILQTRNLISGNTGPLNTAPGIFITGPGANNNLVAGNLIGIDNNPMDPHPLPNGNGIAISFGAQNNIIGDATPRLAPPQNTIGRQNIISGNLGAGIQIYDRNTSNNLVVRNLIGLVLMNGDPNLPLPMGNGEGVDIFLAASQNRIGGLICPVIGGTMCQQANPPDSRDMVGNFIESSNREGVRIYDSATTENLVQGNLIGIYRVTNPDRILPFPNDIGVGLAGFSNGNLIGGTVVYQQQPDVLFLQAGNVISGNNRYGVAFYDRRTFGNLVQGNMIGPDPTGQNTVVDSVGNLVQQVGVTFFGGAVNNTLGGTVPLGGTVAGSGNLISGNIQAGITILGQDTANNLIMGNYIGTDITGRQRLDNGNFSGGGNGIKIYFSAHDNTIGGTVAGSGNLISGNPLDGVLIYTGAPAIPGTMKNVVTGNVIGLDSSGFILPADFNRSVTTLGNGLNGVHIMEDVTDKNIIGGTTTGSGNTIGFNGQEGVLVDAGVFNSIWHNNIAHHETTAGALGIHLVNNGNNLIPAPDISTVTASYDQVTTTVTLSGTVTTPMPNNQYILEFFAVTGNLPAEGERFIGAITGTSDDTGVIVLDPDPLNPPTFTVFLTPAFQFVSATITNVDMAPMDGDTSQFSTYIPLPGTGPGGDSPGIFGKKPGVVAGLVSKSSSSVPVVSETAGAAIDIPPPLRDWDLAFAGLQPAPADTHSSEWNWASPPPAAGSDWDFWLSNDGVLWETV